MKDQQVRPANRYILIAIFLVLTLLALGDMARIIPSLAPIVSNPLFFLFYESHDLLALIVALYAAHKLSPAAGLGGIVWFIVLHIPYALISFALDVPELVRQAILLFAAILGIRIIVIRNRLEAELKSQRTAAFKRADELTILNGIATIGVQATSVDTLIEDAIRVIDSALHPDYFDICLTDEAAGMLRVYHSTSASDKDDLMISMGEGVVGKVVKTGTVQRIPDVSLEPAYLTVNLEARSELCVPLKVGKHVIGVINIESKRLNDFSDADEQLMVTFGDQLVTAIEKVRLFQLEQRHAHEAETLREAGAAVAATLSQDETIERILIQLNRVIPYDTASVQLLGNGYLEIVGGHGWLDASAVVGMRFPIPGDNPNTIVIQERRPFMLGNAPTAFSAFRDGPHSHILSFLGVPLIVGNEVIGMLAIDNKKADFFVPDQIRMVTAFADQVALAIQNARLFSEVQQLAHTDSLTGLHNRRHFTVLARHEFERARRYQRPLAAIMLDIDHFKNINDTYGHAVGDQVLQEVAARCQKIMRGIDILGRYGGDEFVSILLETDLKGAVVVTERLRQCVVEPLIDTDCGPLTITISLGISIFEKECRDLDSLLQRADQALYAAKQAGRNQASVWQP